MILSVRMLCFKILFRDVIIFCYCFFILSRAVLYFGTGQNTVFVFKYFRNIIFSSARDFLGSVILNSFRGVIDGTLRNFGPV